MTTLIGIDVCFIAWYTIMDVFKATYYQWKENVGDAMHAKHHGNLRTNKPHTHTLQTIAILQLMLEQLADHMPHKTGLWRTKRKLYYNVFYPLGNGRNLC
jgi:hypothetical protein